MVSASAAASSTGASAGASAACFVTWGFAVRRLGAVATTVYIYLVPLVTVAASALVLGERPTPAALVGMALILAGLFLSEKRGGQPKEKEMAA